MNKTATVDMQVVVFTHNLTRRPYLLPGRYFLVVISPVLSIIFAGIEGSNRGTLSTPAM